MWLWKSGPLFEVWVCFQEPSLKPRHGWAELGNKRLLGAHLAAQHLLRRLTPAPSHRSAPAGMLNQPPPNPGLHFGTSFSGGGTTIQACVGHTGRHWGEGKGRERGLLPPSSPSPRHLPRSYVQDRQIKETQIAVTSVSDPKIKPEGKPATGKVWKMLLWRDHPVTSLQSR